MLSSEVEHRTAESLTCPSCGKEQQFIFCGGVFFYDDRSNIIVIVVLSIFALTLGFLGLGIGGTILKNISSMYFETTFNIVPKHIDILLLVLLPISYIALYGGLILRRRLNAVYEADFI